MKQTIIELLSTEWDSDIMRLFPLLCLYLFIYANVHCITKNVHHSKLYFEDVVAAVAVLGLFEKKNVFFFSFSINFIGALLCWTQVITVRMKLTFNYEFDWHALCYLNFKHTDKDRNANWARHMNWMCIYIFAHDPAHRKDWKIPVTIDVKIARF